MKKILSISILLILTASLFFNYILYNKVEEVKIIENINRDNENYFKKDLDVFNSGNNIFKDIYLNKDYEKFDKNFNHMMQENPIGAYLLSNTFYNITKDKNVIEKIEMSESQLKSIYNH